MRAADRSIESTTKAVILARGLGRRMQAVDTGAPLTGAQASTADAGIKGMIDVGRPFLDHVLSGLADAGLHEVCFVIGPGTSPIRDRYTSGVSRLQVAFAIQEEPRGTADAVRAAVDFAGEDPFLVLNADNLYPVEAVRSLTGLGGSGLVGFDATALTRDANIPAERIRKFAIVEVTDASNLRAIHEKPDDATYARLAPHSLVSMNLWSFTPVIFAACQRVTLSPRGELELQDAVRIAMEDFGEPFRVIPFAGGVLDLSTRADIAEVQRRLAGNAVGL
jgi:dTDP-glucose pyrophosphorylase